MPKPPPRKPLFCPPVVNATKSNAREVPSMSKPNPGVIGWQEDMVKNMETETEGESLFQEGGGGDQSKGRPKPGEEVWLQATGIIWKLAAPRTPVYFSHINLKLRV